MTFFIIYATSVWTTERYRNPMGRRRLPRSAQVWCHVVAPIPPLLDGLELCVQAVRTVNNPVTGVDALHGIKVDNLKSFEAPGPR